ncbi:protein MAK16-like protein A-like [Hibiscus syriacus]|uniref:Protein MAK16-like protein A-like n=1 Tax=Hibiscus syriacus TaxID=106335 RepID=A0A6A3BHS2_HIBSY|nr:uncharacterized protein LOC120215132 [Hibiscus syriacus]KAE8716566.1 protein MAK16-like protein A-like [Hibiscus syriacus]
MVGTNPTIKFLCSYGGKIIPRYPDGKLRYNGGETRVLAVDPSISFDTRWFRSLSDEDLANLIEEYDRVASPPSSLKIRALLSQPKSAKKAISSPSSSSASSSKSSSSSTPRYSCLRQISGTPVAFPLCSQKYAGKMIPYYGYHGNPSHIYLLHSGNHWQ